jgi:hypothetical protein
LLRCRRAERRLGIRRWRLPVRPGVVIMGLLGVGTVGLAVFALATDYTVFPSLNPLRYRLEDGWLALRRLSWAERMYAVSTLVILGYIYLVSRAARS